MTYIDAEEDPAQVRLRESVCVFKIARGLARISNTDDEILSNTFIVFDSFYAQLSAEAKEKSSQQS